MKNIIYYGPPGTGKTYIIQNMLKEYTSIEISDEIIIQSLSHGKEWLVIALIIIKQNNLATNTDIMDKLLELNIETNEMVSTILSKHTFNNNTIFLGEEPRIFETYGDKWYVNLELFKDKEYNLYNEYIKNFSKKRYSFVTFHQSFGYEDFIEGIKPKLNKSEDENTVDYYIEDGIFKRICNLAKKVAPQKCAIFIDEINRGNISEIFGELLSLIEVNKREGQAQELNVLLPYSKEEFTVPANLDIYGTMNSTDRGTANIDIALRRRFEFIPVTSNSKILLEAYHGTGIDPENIDGINIIRLLDTINKRIWLLLDGNYSIGHAYFCNITNLDDIKKVMVYKVIPLLEEYFFNEPEKIQLILNDLDENGDLDENALYIHEELVSSSLLRYFGEFYIDDKRIYRIKNIEDITQQGILKIYEY